MSAVIVNDTKHNLEDFTRILSDMLKENEELEVIVNKRSINSYVEYSYIYKLQSNSKYNKGLNNE